MVVIVLNLVVFPVVQLLDSYGLAALTTDDHDVYIKTMTTSIQIKLFS